MKELRVDDFADAHAALCEPKLRQSLYDAGAVIMDSVLLNLHGAAHKARRQLELKVFRRELLLEYEREVFPPTLHATLAPFLAQGSADLLDFGFRVTMNLTADFAGIDRPAGSAEETARLLALVRTFSEGATLVHSTRNHDEVRAEVQDALQAFQIRFLEPSLARRRALLARGDDSLRLDVLSVLLKNEDRIELPDEVLTREIGFYLQAGAHSTANSMVHALHEIFEWIAEHPDDARRIREEPLFVQRCVHESMRLHPASPVAWRTPVAPVTLRDGRSLSPGERLIIDLAAANRDPAVFGADAARFDPHRTPPGDRVYPYGLTFGTGVHLCPGRDLDGGIAFNPQSPQATHMFGIVTQLIAVLFEHNVRREPDNPPVADETTARSNWRVYPVLLDRTGPST